MIKIQRTYQNQIATLYLVATPIGNLQAISLNVIQLLQKIPVVFCEDTRISQKLFEKHQIKNTKHSFHKFNEKNNWKQIINHLQKGNDVALITCAGIPLIADPGFDLVKRVIAADFNVTAMGVNSAFLAALICSGIDVKKFTFYNFLKAKKAQKTKQILEILKLPNTIVCYESVHKMRETLLFLQKVAPQRQFCLGREISKKYETFYRGYLEELNLKTFTFKGEFVLVMAGNKKENNYKIQTFLDKIKYAQLTNKQILTLGKTLFGLKHKKLYEVLNVNKKNNK